MDVKEEVAKLTIGEIVGAVSLLVGSLVLIVFREILVEKWVQVTAGLSTRGLSALLGLALIAVAIEGLSVAYLMRLAFRRGKALERASLLPPPRKPIRRFGVHWDEEIYPLCPVCDGFLPIHHNDGAYEVLWCPKCKVEYSLMDDYAERVSLVDAKLELQD
jgi:hypothetical protein